MASTRVGSRYSEKDSREGSLKAIVKLFWRPRRAGRRSAAGGDLIWRPARLS